MIPCEVLLLDSGASTCRNGQCGRIAALVESSLARSTVRRRIDALNTECPGLIIIRSDASDGVAQALETAHSKWRECPVFALFCGASDIPISLFESLDDFASCPVSEPDFVLRLRVLVSRRQARSSAEPRPPRPRVMLDSLVGESPSFLATLERIPFFADSIAPVLLLGETGTGKELFARAIHYSSPRRRGPFVPVNCGSLPDNLFENELFGHAKGAFTDASTSEKGVLAFADGGSVFLDEVDSLSPYAQVKLLRFLQDREYRPLGSTKSVVADVRIIAASNADLRRLVQARVFREDLYHRLNVLSLMIPPLRERSGDINLLTRHFLERFTEQYGRGTLRVSPRLMRKLLAHRWPGNIRELESQIHRAVVLSKSATLDAGDIDLPEAGGTHTCSVLLREAKQQIIDQFERTYLSELLAEHKGNISRAAKAAGKERRTFQRLIRKHRISYSGG